MQVRAFLSLLGGRGQGPGHEDMMLISHSPVSRSDTIHNRDTFEQCFHIVSLQEWSYLNLASQRERGKVGHHIHLPNIAFDKREAYSESIVSLPRSDGLLLKVEYQAFFTSK